MSDFIELGVSEMLNNELRNNNIVSPTTIQEKALPFIINNEDVLVQSRTGSGKTISFAIPTIDNIDNSKVVNTLVVTPTRELAKQVSGEFEKFSKFKNLKVATIYGGVSITQQIHDLRKANIVVGTPGRLLDLMRKNFLRLDKVEKFILDEADRMLDMGFSEDIDSIVKKLPKKRQNLMFSATINSKIMRVMEKYLNNPKKILLDNVIEQEQLEQYYYDVQKSKKLPLLVQLFKELKPESSIIFCNTKGQTRYITKSLRLNGIHAECMNGDMTQQAREKTLKKFRDEEIPILVGTNVLARGLDVEGITHIFNFDLPNDAETYTHRIGRTARNGKKGTAIILLSPEDFDNMKEIKRKYGDKIKLAEVDSISYVKLPENNQRNNNHNNSHRRIRRRLRR
ncbi:ATP-dependent helicase [archaeon CG_4_10_14_0_2_um_filter_Archaea_38_6]|nr:MAG: ATP-dependent helicase [archaeon CG07_land_8_20_14_0_80_38_8]PIU88764.1 MAG: ATP-dependent helicase [archaeon CG06_land_8_20_14_3_00_37_11]PJA23167.1 MAG: ATP-dependent helicase [archaeon CG_4_10_14_0_2_um_filter_Archaea_38_6]